MSPWMANIIIREIADSKSNQVSSSFLSILKILVNFYIL